MISFVAGGANGSERAHAHAPIDFHINTRCSIYATEDLLIRQILDAALNVICLFEFYLIFHLRFDYVCYVWNFAISMGLSPESHFWCCCVHSVTPKIFNMKRKKIYQIDAVSHKYVQWAASPATICSIYHTTEVKRRKKKEISIPSKMNQSRAWFYFWPLNKYRLFHSFIHSLSPSSDCFISPFIISSSKSCSSIWWF